MKYLIIWMDLMKKVTLYIIIGLFFSFLATAKPGKTTITKVTQPDGTSFTLISYGDEFCRIRKTSDGCAVFRDKDGWWCYQGIDNMGRKYNTSVHVSSQAPADILAASRNENALLAASAQERMRSDMLNLSKEPIISRIRQAQGTKAEEGVTVKYGIVLLVAFKDVPFTYAKADFEAMLTQKGYSMTGGTGSAKDYFEDQFGSNYEFIFDVSDIITLDKNREYYGGNNSKGSDKAPAEMVAEACQIAYDMGIDFTPYDQDNDSEVDNVFVIYAGEDEADYSDGKHDDCIWAHSWWIKDGAGISLTLGGKTINRYACSSELSPVQNKLQLTGIGTFCHEYSHTLGLVDTYDTDYEASGGVCPGLWCYSALMDGGNANNNSNTPPYYNAIDRELLGIQESVTITRDGTYRLSPISKGGTIYKIETDYKDEYFLLECRDNDGWDKHIGGSGMLVYHIDKSDRQAGQSDNYGNLTAKLKWEFYNAVNISPTRPCADLLEADGRTESFDSFENYYRFIYSNPVSGVYFPRTGIDAINSKTIPGFKFWSGAPNVVSISDITREGSDITFYLSGYDAQSLPEVDVDDKWIFQNDAIIEFSVTLEDWEGNAVIEWGKTGQEMQTMEISPYRTGKYTAILSGLDPSTSYSCRIAFTSEGGSVGKKASVSFTTARKSSGWPYISFKNVERNEDGSFNSESKIPLVVWNSASAAQVRWYFDGKIIQRGSDGFFHPSKSGQLKAVVNWEDGSEDIIIKDIKIKNE